MSERRRDDQNDWIRHANVSESERPLLVRKRCNSRLIFAIGLIALGVLLFLGNLGILPIHDVWIFWPALPIVGGISRLQGGQNSTARVWGILMVLFGSLFLLLNLGLIHIHAENGSWPFSLILIAVGVTALFSVLESSRKAQGEAGTSSHSFWQRPVVVDEHSLNDFAVLGSVKRRVESSNFGGGDVTAILGNVEIDLRNALIDSSHRGALLNVTAIFGAIKLRVPQAWRVHMNGTSILGNFEDKTIPPNLGPVAPSLVITGLAVFGAVEIED